MQEVRPLAIYAELPSDATVYVVPTQFYGESGVWKGTPVALQNGRNYISVPKIGNLSDTRGGPLYITYSGSHPEQIKLQVRVVNNAWEMPVLELSDWYSMGESARKDAMVNAMYQNVLAWEEELFIANKVQGIIDSNATLTSYQYPMTTRQNIRYMRMFAGAFMYAAGNHIGVEYGSTSALVQGKPTSATGKGNANGLFGWGIAHEIGHNMDKLGKAEITNNIYSLALQAWDGSSMALNTRLTEDGRWETIFNKVAQGRPGSANNVFVQLGMYWQLHLAYDDAQPLAFYNQFFKLWKSGAHSGYTYDERVAYDKTISSDLYDLSRQDGTITITMKNGASVPVTGIKVTGTGLSGQYTVKVKSNAGADWTTAKTGTLSDDTVVAYFTKPGAAESDTRIWTYDAAVLEITGIPEDATVSCWTTPPTARSATPATASLSSCPTWRRKRSSTPRAASPMTIPWRPVRCSTVLTIPTMLRASALPVRPRGSASPGRTTCL